MSPKLHHTSIEFCAGAGGQALGLEHAGFRHLLLVDNDADCCATLRLNRPNWQVECADMNAFVPPVLPPVDLFAAGLPCPPFSIAGKQLGAEDDRNLFPAAFRLIETYQPRAVLIENVRGFLSPGFQSYRDEIVGCFRSLGYDVDWRLFDASSFGVSQTRARVAIVAMKQSLWPHFQFPTPTNETPRTVGALLHDLMSENGWEAADTWAQGACKIAPTIVGGSKKHGGPDLGPTRARAAWRALGVNGGSVAETAPHEGFEGLPRLTIRMVARVQGFPDDWAFHGKKTAAYRQVGNAFPPPVAARIGRAIRHALEAADRIEGSLEPVAAE